jgi:hypothetical protein
MPDTASRLHQAVPAACRDLITTADRHVRALLLPLGDPALTCRVMGDAAVQAAARVMWRCADAGETAATQAAARAWYRAVQQARDRVGHAPAPLNDHNTEEHHA